MGAADFDARRSLLLYAVLCDWSGKGVGGLNEMAWAKRQTHLCEVTPVAPVRAHLI